MKQFFGAVIFLFLATGTLQAESLLPDRVFIPIYTGHYYEVPSDETQPQDFTPGVYGSWDNRILSLDYGFGILNDSFQDLAFQVSIGKGWDLGPDAVAGVFWGYRRAFDDTASNTEGLSFPAFYATYKNVFINTVGGVVDGTLQGIVTFGLKFDLTPR